MNPRADSLKYIPVIPTPKLRPFAVLKSSAPLPASYFALAPPHSSLLRDAPFRFSIVLKRDPNAIQSP